MIKNSKKEQKIIEVKFITNYEIGIGKRSGYLFTYQDKTESFFIQLKDTICDNVQVTALNKLINLSSKGYIFKWVN